LISHFDGPPLAFTLSLVFALSYDPAHFLNYLTAFFILDSSFRIIFLIIISNFFLSLLKDLYYLKIDIVYLNYIFIDIENSIKSFLASKLNFVAFIIILFSSLNFISTILNAAISEGIFPNVPPLSDGLD